MKKWQHTIFSPNGEKIQQFILTYENGKKRPENKAWKCSLSQQGPTWVHTFSYKQSNELSLLVVSLISILIDNIIRKNDDRLQKCFIVWLLIPREEYNIYNIVHCCQKNCSSSEVWSSDNRWEKNLYWTD